MSKIQSPRGTRDILPGPDQDYWNYVHTTVRQVAYQMNFQPITTPTYEELALFQRSIGAGTDVMDKELFLVRGVKTETGKEEYALRPEGTAGIVRAFIEHGMHTWPQPVRLYGIVNNFRYDRPQKGRYREHTQVSAEYFGDKGPFADAWIIYYSWRLLQELGLEGLELRLNSLGTTEERVEYIKAFGAYLEPVKDKLSEESRTRLGQNPLRILDSKDAGDQALCAEAPRLHDFFGEESNAHFAKVQEYLTAWNIPFVITPSIVRGLDYYSHTTFEWVIKNTTGQQNSLGGGGRYDGLVTQLGGPDVGAVGVGIGLDRVMEAMQDQKVLGDMEAEPATELFLVAADDAGRAAIPTLIDELLTIGWRVDTAFTRDSINAQFKMAGRSGALASLILGETEVSKSQVVVKNMQEGSQETINRADLRAYLKKQFIECECDDDSCDCCAE